MFKFLSKIILFGENFSRPLILQFNFGSSIAMNKYCELILNFDEYNTNFIKRPEDFLILHCKKKK